MTAASFWPFLRRSAVSIVLINELGAVPIKAGRNSGSVEPGDGEGDRDFGVCDEARPAPTSEATNKRIPTRMGTLASKTRRLCKRNGLVIPNEVEAATQPRNFLGRGQAFNPLQNREPGCAELLTPLHSS